MKAKFIFEGRNRNFEFDKEDTLKDIIIKNTLFDIDDFNFKFNGKLLEPKELLDSQLGLREDVEEIEINVEKKMKQSMESNSANMNINSKPEQKESFLNKTIKNGFGFLSKKVLGHGQKENSERKSIKKNTKIINEESNNIKEPLSLEMGEKNEDTNDNENNKDQVLITNENLDLEKNKIEPKKIYDGDEDSEFILDFTDSYKFFIKSNLILFIQNALILTLVLLGFNFDIDIYFSDSSKAFWWTIVVVTVYASAAFIFTTFLAMDKDGNIKWGQYVLVITYIPMIVIYCFLLSKNGGVDFLEKKYIIYQLIIFTLDFLFSIIYNLIFKTYRGWLLLFILAIINIVTIVIYYFPLSNNYDNLKMSYGAFQGISIISSIMLFYMLLFNSPIMRLFEIDITDGDRALYGAALFNYIPFALTAFSILLALVLSIFAIIIAILIAILIICLVGLLVVSFISSLFVD